MTTQRGMTLNEYQDEAGVTRNPLLQYSDNLLNGALGAAGEAGELADHLKKVCFQGHKFDQAHVVNELGDMLWYIADLATTLGITLEEVAVYNVGKLRSRYNGAGFSTEASVNRTDN